MSGSQELWLSVVNEIIADLSPTDKMIDVCCGECAVTRNLNFKSVQACDVIWSPLIPDSWVFTNKEAVPFLKHFHSRSVDLVICSDGLEHHTFLAGKELLRQMNRVGRIAIVFTPTGDTEYNPRAKNPHAHKSSWSERDFHELGWETKHFPDWHPTLGWGAIFAWKKSA